MLASVQCGYRRRNVERSGRQKLGMHRFQVTSFGTNRNREGMGGDPAARLLKVVVPGAARDVDGLISRRAADVRCDQEAVKEPVSGAALKEADLHIIGGATAIDVWDNGETRVRTGDVPAERKCTQGNDDAEE